MTLEDLLQRLGDRVSAADEETFDLFSQELPSQQNLGFVDSRSQLLDLSVAGYDLTIHQSPAILSSNRAGGTTGAGKSTEVTDACLLSFSTVSSFATDHLRQTAILVLWKITPVFAEWLSRPDNILFTSGILSSHSAIIELGCGISAVLGLLVAPKVGSYVLTDQAYVSKLVNENITENSHVLTARTAGMTERFKGSRKPKVIAPGSGLRSAPSSAAVSGRLVFRTLDWETDEVTPALTGSPTVRSFDAVVCCDCIYNEALVEPLVQTCADVCRLRMQDGDSSRTGEGGAPPCVCVVAQQLRDPDVFEAWLAWFAEDFNVWRVPDASLTDGLRSNSGLVVHIGVLKECINPI